MLTIKGNVITIDAMGCQKEIVKQIREKEGDYVIALKGNQGSLHAEAENFSQQAMEVEPSECGCDYVNIIEKNRSRVEERQIWSCALDWLSEEQLEGWVDLKTLVCVKSTRTHKGKTTQKFRYYISSLESKAQRLAEIVRAHRGVEIFHWHLDVAFGEDLCKVRTDHAAENSSKLGVPNKRKLAGWSPEYLLNILGVK